MLIGLPILRLRGVYFAMVTLVLTEVARLSALALPITNGAKGMVRSRCPGALSIFGLTLIPDFATLANPRLAFYLLAVTLMVLCFAAHLSPGAIRASASSASRCSRTRSSPPRSASTSPLRVSPTPSPPSSAASPARSSSAISQSIYPSSFTVADSVNFMLNCFLGGLGYVFGPMLGTLVLYFGWDLLFQTGEFQLLIYSTLLIVLMLVLPNGLLSLGSIARKQG